VTSLPIRKGTYIRYPMGSHTVSRLRGTFPSEVASRKKISPGKSEMKLSTRQPIAAQNVARLRDILYFPEVVSKKKGRKPLRSEITVHRPTNRSSEFSEVAWHTSLKLLLGRKPLLPASGRRPSHGGSPFPWPCLQCESCSS
jgi:hypothetical protein